MSRLKLTSLVVVYTFLLAACAHADALRFGRYFSDDMVLQRDKAVKVSGFAPKNAKVTVTFADQKKEGVADKDGNWSVTLDPMPAANAGRALAVASSIGNLKSSIGNVLVGDVVLFARQTSIDVSLGRDKEGKAAVAKLSANPNFRVLRIKTIPASEPQTDLAPEATGGWVVVDKKEALKMSASAYYLGSDLVSGAGVPVGIIDLNMGPNFTIGWIDLEAIQSNDDYYGKRTSLTRDSKYLLSDFEKFQAQKGKEPPEDRKGWIENNPVTSPLYPAAGYNAVLNPLRGIALKAALVQLGNDYPYLAYEKVRKEGGFFDREELDPLWWITYEYRKYGYRAAFEVLPRMPLLWRKYFDDNSLPLAFVMPPSSSVGSYAMYHREVRELQRQVSEANDGVGLVMPGVEHVPFSGQPADDGIVAKRSMAWIRSSVYGKQDVSPCGPLFERVEMDFNKAQVFFKKGTAEGLKSSGDALNMFEVAAVDAEWFPAKARIDGDTIRLESADVNQIAYVRYNYKKQPDYGLTNGEGLPAIPFRTGEHEWIDVPRNVENSLPAEYTATADTWDKSSVAIINGGGAVYQLGSGWLGATGIRAVPFGPNMKVVQILPGSPADGKIQVDDFIYRVNGELLGESHLKTVAKAIDIAESEAGAGRIEFSLRRDDKLHEVELTIEVLGTRSSTSPYDCPKTARIVANFEKFLAERGGLSTEAVAGGWLHSDSMFLLANGTPEYQGLVRRFVYRRMEQIASSDQDTKAWYAAYGAMFFGEYYLATGDRNVLPCFRKLCIALENSQCREGTFEGLNDRQIGGWRHNYPGGAAYGMMPTIGLAAMIGWELAMESGVEVDPHSYALGLRFFTDNQATMGQNDYSSQAAIVKAPEVMDPEQMANGMISGHNGARGLAATFYNLIGDTRIAHLNSTYCRFAYNVTYMGHANNFFHVMWTPLGASLQGKKPFIAFMKGNYWFQDLKRMFNHGYTPSVGQNLAVLVPKRRLRVMGAAPSVFAVDAPAIFKPARDAYFARDYAKASKMADDLLAGGALNSDDRTKATQLARAAKELQESIDIDLAKLEGLIKEGKLYEASLDLPQLKGVVPEGDARLAKIEKAVTATDAVNVLAADKERYDALQETLAFSTTPPDTKAVTDEGWVSLTTEEQVGRNGARISTVNDGNATVWRAKGLESIADAPEGWSERDFDDSKWNSGMLPFSWHLNHSLVARAEFDVKDVKAIKALRLSAHPFRQQNILVYINGKLVAKLNQCENYKGWMSGDLKQAAIKYLRNGKNTIAFRTTNDWRWASSLTPILSGFGLTLEAKTEGDEG